MERNSQSPVFVAVIDDEADLAYLFREALSQIDGVQVFAFTDPSLALEHFKANHPNYMVVISDYRMPTMTGMEFPNGNKTIALTPNMKFNPYIFCSSDTDKENIKKINKALC